MAEDGNYVTVGPVIGYVTENSARVLLEFAKDGDVTVALSPISEKEWKYRNYKYLPCREQRDPTRVTKTVKANRPCVFQFKELIFSTRYRVDLEDSEGGQFTGLFSTLDPGNFTIDIECATFCIVSGNNIEAQGVEGVKDVWPTLLKNLKKGEYQYALHIGNQVYAEQNKLYAKYPAAIDAKEVHFATSNMNRLHATALEMLKAHTNADLRASGVLSWQREADVRLAEKIMEMYRELYRETWSHPPTAEFLASIPNIMMLDEFDVFGDLGDVAGVDHSDSTSIEGFIAQCARIVYYEYQRSLTYESTKKIEMYYDGSIGGEHMCIKLGDVGLLFLDTRTCRSWNKTAEREKKEYMGLRQWQTVDQVVNDEGEFKDCLHLICISAIPVLWFGTQDKNDNNVILEKREDHKSHWHFPQAADDQQELLETILAWKYRRDVAEDEPRPDPFIPPREITFLSSSVMHACHTDVYYEGRLAMQQFVCGPICNAPLNWDEIYKMKKRPPRMDCNETGFEFNNYHHCSKRNYGVLRVNCCMEEFTERAIIETIIVGANYYGTEVVSFEEYHSMCEQLGGCSIM
jgi:hypothetical protein